MVFILPTDEELGSELEKHAADYLDAEAILKADTNGGIYFKFTQTAGVDPADAHGV